jgi:hypothetical protein
MGVYGLLSDPRLPNNQNLWDPVSFFQEKQTEQAFGSHNMQQEHLITLDPVEDATGRNDNSPIQGLCQFGRTLSGIWKSFKALHTLKYPFDEVGGRRRVVQRDIVGNRFEIA